MIGLTRALWRRLEDMWTVQHPPSIADVGAATEIALGAERLADHPLARGNWLDEQPPARALSEPLVPRVSPHAGETAVYHTCEPLTDSTGVTRGRCPACRAWRELANEDP